MTRRKAKGDPLERDIELALHPGSFIGYRESTAFVEALERVAERFANLSTRAPTSAVALYETFLAACYEKANEVDDSDGSFGSFVGDLFGAWVKARRVAGADPDETASRLLAWMDADEYGFSSGIEREIVKSLDKPGLAVFERRVRARFDGRAPPTTGRRRHDAAYLERRAAAILRAILLKQRRVEAYVELCEATELSAEDCLAVAGMLEARRKPAEALAWIERGLEVEKERSWSFSSDDLARRSEISS